MLRLQRRLPQRLPLAAGLEGGARSFSHRSPHARGLPGSFLGLTARLQRESWGTGVCGRGGVSGRDSREQPGGLAGPAPGSSTVPVPGAARDWGAGGRGHTSSFRPAAAASRCPLEHICASPRGPGRCPVARAPAAVGSWAVFLCPCFLNALDNAWGSGVVSASHRQVNPPWDPQFFHGKTGQIYFTGVFHAAHASHADVCIRADKRASMRTCN